MHVDDVAIVQHAYLLRRKRHDNASLICIVCVIKINEPLELGCTSPIQIPPAPYVHPVDCAQHINSVHGVSAAVQEMASHHCTVGRLRPTEIAHHVEDSRTHPRGVVVMVDDLTSDASNVS
jgi:hypothetical protein